MAQAVSTNWFNDYPDCAFLRERQIIGSPKDPNSRRLIPISRATLWRMVKAGRFPPPQKLGPNIAAWNVGLIRAWLTEKSNSLDKMESK